MPKTALPWGGMGPHCRPHPPPHMGLSTLLSLQELMERLQGIVTRPQHLGPAQNSKVHGGGGWAGAVGPAGEKAASPPTPAAQITSDHRAEFARCLEPLLLLGPRRATGAGGGTNT